MVRGGPAKARRIQIGIDEFEGELAGFPKPEGISSKLKEGLALGNTHL